jgi:hypothetical protein
MKVSIVPDDKVIIIDGKPIEFDYSISSDIHAIQWYKTEGEIEYKDINKPNEKITDFSDYQYLVDLHSSEDQKIEDKKTADLAAEQAAEDARIAAKLAWTNSWERIREERNGLLYKYDWTQLPDVRLTTIQVDKWKVYREALRDITDDFATVKDVVWPKPPLTTRVLEPVEIE